MSFAKDKIGHFKAGFMVGLIAVFIGWWGLVVVAGAGGVKEFIDKYGNGTPEWMDFIATFVGGSASVILVKLAIRTLWTG